MAIIRHELMASCPPGHVWALLSDLEAVDRYNPGVRAVSIEGAQRTGVGASRTCDLRPKGRVVERVTHWEEERALGLEIAASDWPIHFMRWTTRLEPRGRTTRITQDLEYKLKFGPLGWLLDRLIVKRKLTRTLDAVLAGLIERAEASCRGGAVLTD